MKKVMIILTILMFMSFSFISCQKAKEPEGKKEGLAQKEEVQKELAEAKPDILPKSQTEPPLTKEEELQQWVELIESGLTGEERETVKAKLNGEIFRENFESDEEVKEYLKILLKGNHRMFHLETPYPAEEIEKEKIRKFQYGDTVGILLSFLDPKIDKEAFDIAVEILKTKREYPEAVAKAARAVKFAHDTSVIPLLREVAQHSAPKVRLEAAGSLLSLGDSDISLPVLDELTEKEGYTQSLYYLFKGPGKIIDERGYKIVEKALNYPKAEVRITAIKLLSDAKKINKAKVETVALNILEKLKDKKCEDYGIEINKDLNRGLYYKLSGYEGKRLRELEDAYHSDGRACDNAVYLLAGLKSKKAIPLLKYIHEKNTNLGCVCHENLIAGGGFAQGGGGMAENALKKINEEKSETLSNELSAAIEEGDIPKVKDLLNKVGGVNAKNKKGQTPLMDAAHHNQPKIVKLLLDKGAGVNAKDQDGRTALMYADRNWDSRSAFSSEEPEEPLETVKLLLRKGADLNAKDKDGKTALMYAAKQGLTEVTKLLIGKGAAVNAKDNDDRTALMYAVLSGQIEVAELLIDRGADVNVKERYQKGRTAFMEAVNAALPEPVKNGWTALMYAVDIADVIHPEMVKLLLDKGAKVNAKNEDGITALMIAVFPGRPINADAWKIRFEIVKLLIDRGADVNAKDNYDRTVLMMAARWSTASIVTFLIDKGADVNAKTKGGGTALTFAGARGSSTMIKLLQHAGAK